MEPAPTSTQAERGRVYTGAVLPHKLLDELALYVSPTSYSLEARFGCSATFRSGASLNTRLLPSEEEY